MTNKELYDLTKYLFESWERGADYDNYHMDSQYVLEALAQPENGKKCHDCGGMGYQDGIGDRCPTCNGFGQQPEQEPVATVTSETGNPDVTMSWWHEPALPVGTKLYPTPPKEKNT